jgi:hypothetical protein
MWINADSIWVIAAVWTRVIGCFLQSHQHIQLQAKSSKQLGDICVLCYTLMVSVTGKVNLKHDVSIEYKPGHGSVLFCQEYDHSNYLNYATNLTKQNPSWESNNHSYNQEIPHLSWSLKVHYHIQRSLSQMNPVQTLIPYFSENHFNISLWSPNWPLPLTFSD